MAGVTEVRAAVAAAIVAAGLDSVDHVPASIVPPVVIISTGEPYIMPGGGTFGELTANLELYAIAGTAETDVELSTLEDMIETLASDFSAAFISASAPYMAVANGIPYLTSKIKLSVEYRQESE